MGVFKLNEEGHYDIEPIEITSEAKVQIKTLVDEWREWANRFEEGEAQRMVISICITELEMLSGLTSFKDLKRR